MGITDKDLHCYATPEQCFADYIPYRKDNMVLLVCENKDIWFNIRRLMFEKGKSEILGRHIDGVIFGDGNEVTGKGKFCGYAKFLSGENTSFLYCGDIDRAGFDIYLRLKRTAEELDISLFVPIYKKMLELCDLQKLPSSSDNRNINVDMSEILPLFSDNEKSKIKKILEENKRLPQEIVNYGVLCKEMK
jgi:hypothetical protein